jgi:predicted protein tyrosine phosphatase
MVLSERAAYAYKWFKQRDQELTEIASQNDGKLALHELWRLAYYKQPYLLLQSDEVILERFRDVFMNGLDLNHKGQIMPTPMLANENRLGRLFTEIIEETNWRCILTKDSMSEGLEQLNTYFSNGTPAGVKMFEGRTDVKGDWLVKFSKKQFIEDAFNHGRLRISPASEYAKGSHLRAVKDLETARTYKLRAFAEAMRGETSVKFQEHTLPIKRGVVDLEVVMDDYFLFSTCMEISRRMPTDFEADAALIIKDKQAFIARLRKALLRQYSHWEFLEGDVYYYDPFNDIPKDRNQELWKHISYSYQQEHRCVLRRKHQENIKLDPFFVELGPLDDIAEIVFASQV